MMFDLRFAICEAPEQSVVAYSVVDDCVVSVKAESLISYRGSSSCTTR